MVDGLVQVAQVRGEGEGGGGMVDGLVQVAQVRGEGGGRRGAWWMGWCRWHW